MYATYSHCSSLPINEQEKQEFLIHFGAWAQQWLVCALLRIHLEPINKQLMLLVTIQS